MIGRILILEDKVITFLPKDLHYVALRNVCLFLFSFLSLFGGCYLCNNCKIFRSKQIYKIRFFR